MFIASQKFAQPQLVSRMLRRLVGVEIVCRARAVLKNPTIPQWADCPGLNVAINETEIRDLIIVSGGPAGLADGQPTVARV